MSPFKVPTVPSDCVCVVHVTAMGCLAHRCAATGLMPGGQTEACVVLYGWQKENIPDISRPVSLPSSSPPERRVSDGSGLWPEWDPLQRLFHPEDTWCMESPCNCVSDVFNEKVQSFHFHSPSLWDSNLTQILLLFFKCTTLVEYQAFMDNYCI